MDGLQIMPQSRVHSRTTGSVRKSVISILALISPSLTIMCERPLEILIFGTGGMSLLLNQQRAQTTDRSVLAE